MTKKKEKETKKEAFNLDEALENLEIPYMLIAGFKAYIESNNLKFKSQKEFEKSLQEFRELKL